MGHFRSTIIGNFIANIHQVLGHNVIRINWLGDWGTQFGLLAFGLKDQNVQEFHDPIHQLFHIYVDINRDELSLCQELEAYVSNDNPRPTPHTGRKSVENSLWEKLLNLKIGHK